MLYSSKAVQLKKFEHICRRRLHIVPKPGVAYRDAKGQRRYYPITVAGYADCPKCDKGAPLDLRLIKKRA